MQNPAIGREAELGDLQATRSPRRVVVVGGGPGGLEAARVAAARGHAVTLFERRRELGGQVLTAARAPGRAEYIGIARWLAAQVHVHKVDVRLGVFATKDDVLALRPDVVISPRGRSPGRRRPRLPRRRKSSPPARCSTGRRRWGGAWSCSRKTPT